MGESYAGKYVPTVAKYIIEQNKALPNGTALINISIKGAALGDPFTNPIDMTSELGMFAYNMGLLDVQ